MDPALTGCFARVCYAVMRDSIFDETIQSGVFHYVETGGGRGAEAGGIPHRRVSCRTTPELLATKTSCCKSLYNGVHVCIETETKLVCVYVVYSLRAHIRLIEIRIGPVHLVLFQPIALRCKAAQLPRFPSFWYRIRQKICTI